MSSDAIAVTTTREIKPSGVLSDRLRPTEGDNILVWVKNVSEALKDPVHAAETRIERAIEMLHRMVGLSADRSVRGSGYGGGLAPWQIRRLTLFVNDHIAESLVISDLATVVRLSPHHFCRAFRVSLGESPHRYLLRRRVARAEQLMRSTRLPLGQIATACGFADQAHFTRVFSATCGVSPGAWRRREAERSVEVELAVYGPVLSQRTAKEPHSSAGVSRHLEHG
jgi:AraC family transcriptional regulator